MRCFFGAGDAIEQATPYHGWRHVFATLLDIDDRAGDAEREARAVQAVGARAPLLNPVLGLDLARHARDGRAPDERRIQATRQFLLELLSEAVDPAAVDRLDDAHWLDSASWALVREYVRRGLPGADAAGQPPDGHARARVRADARRAVRLGADRARARSADDDALDLACERLGAAWLGAGVSALILDRAAGNPLFVEEIARALADAGADPLDASGPAMVAPGADLDDLGLPDTVEGVIANRMEGLDPPVDLTLKVSAVVGPTFAAELVRDVYPLETRRPAASTSSLDALVRRDLTQLIQPPPGDLLLLPPRADPRRRLPAPAVRPAAGAAPRDRRVARAAASPATSRRSTPRSRTTTRAPATSSAPATTSAAPRCRRSTTAWAARPSISGWRRRRMLGVELPRTLARGAARRSASGSGDHRRAHGRALDREPRRSCREATTRCARRRSASCCRPRPAAFISQQSELFAPDRARGLPAHA